MFTPARMKKMNILLLEKDLHAVAEALGEMKIMHFVEAVRDEHAQLLSKPAASEQVQNCALLLEKAALLSKRLHVEMPGEHAKAEFLALEVIATRIGTISAASAESIKQEDEIDEEIESLSDTIEQISAFRQFNVPVEQIPSFSFLHFATGRMDEKELSRYQKERTPDVVTVPLETSDDGETNVVVVTSKKSRWAAESALEKYGFKPENLSERFEGVPEEIYAFAVKRRDLLQLKKDDLDARLKQIGRKYGDELNWYRRRLRIEQKLLLAEENFGRTAATCLISGWVPEGQADALRLKLAGITGNRMVARLRDPDMAETREVPVLMQHGRLLRPFQLLVSTYGMPNYFEIEPTFLVVLSFLLMFGLMFGDVGQGAVLLVVGLAASFSKLPATLRQIGGILACAGCTAIVGGILFGSVFGSETIIKPLWFNPMEGQNAMTLLAVTVVFGMVMNSLGLVLNVINSFRRKDYADGIVDKFGMIGILFYWGALWLLMKSLVFHWRITVPELVIFLALPSAVVLLREPIINWVFRKPTHGGLEAYIENVMGVFEMFVGFLSNTVSFVRVGAFALAHAGLSLAIFMLADMLSKLPAGDALSLALIVFGNIFIIVFEGLIVSIQCLRLEYYEFFGKFYRGEGKAFAPFSLET